MRQHLSASSLHRAYNNKYFLVTSTYNNRTFLHQYKYMSLQTAACSWKGKEKLILLILCVQIQPLMEAPQAEAFLGSQGTPGMTVQYSNTEKAAIVNKRCAEWPLPATIGWRCRVCQPLLGISIRGPLALPAFYYQSTFRPSRVLLLVKYNAIST